MLATRTLSLAPRSEPTSAPRSNSSVFTFLIALLILLCTSIAVVLRAAIMRHRYRRRMQNALAAGILLPARPLPEHKPKLCEVWVRGANNVRDWDALMPVCATKVPDNYIFEHKETPRSMSPRPPPAGRLMEMLGSAPTLSSGTAQPAKPAKGSSKCSTVQVAVLISMPSQQTIIPPHDPATPPASLKGKEKDPNAPSDLFPDVVFGISTFSSSHEEL